MGGPWFRRLGRGVVRAVDANPWDWVPTLAGVLLIAGLALRLHGYVSYPRFGANEDEVAWAWLGQSLWLYHWPASWSYLPEHLPVTAVATSQGVYLPWVSPWLDHPPLFGLLVGGVALLAGEHTPAEVGPSAIRLVPILLSILSGWLLYVLAVRHVGRATALVGLAVFCLSPWMISASRLVESEWLLAPMLLGVLVLASHRGRLPTALLLVLCVLAPLVKVPGIIVGAAGAVALLTERRWVVAPLALLGAPIGIGLFAAYGAAVDWHQFLLVWQAQAARHTTLVAGRLFLFSSDAGLWNFVPVDDPFWTVGMVGLALMLLRRPLGTESRIPLAFSGYALLMALTAGTEGAQYYDWYRFTVDPLVCIGVGDLVARNLPQLGPPALRRLRARIHQLRAPVAASVDAST
ncbi:MAG: glycosyltransferase family 39 protein [Candidatus Dormibacteria bacterium]|jgi:hypothetical protein